MLTAAVLIWDTNGVLCACSEEFAQVGLTACPLEFPGVLNPRYWGDRVRSGSQYWSGCDRTGLCSADHQDSALSSSVISYAPHSDRWGLLYGWRRGSLDGNLWPGRTVRSHGVYRRMPRHRLPGAPGQVGKMLLNPEMQISFLSFYFLACVLWWHTSRGTCETQPAVCPFMENWHLHRFKGTCVAVVEPC